MTAERLGFSCIPPTVLLKCYSVEKDIEWKARKEEYPQPNKSYLLPWLSTVVTSMLGIMYFALPN